MIRGSGNKNCAENGKQANFEWKDRIPHRVDRWITADGLCCVHQYQTEPEGVDAAHQVESTKDEVLDHLQS